MSARVRRGDRPLAASLEVLEHHYTIHNRDVCQGGMAYDDVADMLCPCRVTLAVRCRACGMPLLGAVVGVGGFPCEHLAQLADGHPVTGTWTPTAPELVAEWLERRGGQL